MKKGSLIVLLALLVAAAFPMSAKSEPKKVKSKKTVYDFEEVDILGKLKKPEGQGIVAPPGFTFNRLLDVDESFLPNIIRSVDEF